MHYIETERLILRHFTDKDANALFTILSDEDVNKFLPMFPLKNIEETKTYIQNRYTAKYTQNKGFYYAICLKENDIKKEFWHQGICTEACRAVIDILKQTDTPYITATHDINNPRSGKVMQALGMKYQYSYEELWQPKNILVTFRMYQLNFDNQEDRIYKKYWDTYPIHFIEEI